MKNKSLGEEMDLPKLKQDLLIFKNKYKHSTDIQTDIDKVIKSVEAQNCANKLYVRLVTRTRG